MIFLTALLFFRTLGTRFPKWCRSLGRNKNVAEVWFLETLLYLPLGAKVTSAVTGLANAGDWQLQPHIHRCHSVCLAPVQRPVVQPLKSCLGPVLFCFLKLLHSHRVNRANLHHGTVGCLYITCITFSSVIMCLPSSICSHSTTSSACTQHALQGWRAILKTLSIVTKDS